MTSLQIGKAIYTILSNNQTVSDLVGTKIFPIISDDENTTFPFIVYRRTGEMPVNNKDFRCSDAVIEILIAADSYTQSIECAEAVREALEGYDGSVCDFYINDIILQYAAEDFVDGVFTQTLQWRIEFNV